MVKSLDVMIFIDGESAGSAYGYAVGGLRVDFLFKNTPTHLYIFPCIFSQIL